MSVNINLQDPAVQRLLGGPSPIEQPSGKRELVQIAGDAPDPSGISDRIGATSTLRMSDTALCHPIITYKDFVLTADVYQTPSEPMFIHLICPKCTNTLTISAARKHIELDVKAGPKGQGLVSVEPFQCTWEVDGAKRRVGFGLGLCRWKVAIDKNVAKDA